ncbi:hypothetical protein C7212DRAFT_351566 [Tuber magnatum]|uniref:Mid2 domain-containing protein n=1 Tax=Tuber magnatum TaxID=42249 RepID=A0A317SQ47_9PEZI|nr:hypothetical protein C7212DRAFT_351566 [Tuber magnatum]
MGFRQRNSALLLALLGLGSILGVDGSWLFGAMEEREQDYRRAMQPRQFVQCSTGSKACGALGCVASKRCCQAAAGWGCLTGNACYTANGYIDCYSTTMVMPTESRTCYDFTRTGCRAGQPCFRCDSTAAFCATEVLAGGGETWLECATKSAVLTVTPTTDAGSTAVDGASIAPLTGTSTGRRPTRTGTTMLPYPTKTTAPEDNKLSGGAIAGIAIGAVAGIAIVGALIFFFFAKRDKGGPTGVAPMPQQYPPQQQPYEQPYSPPPPQQPYMTQPQYGQLSGYQDQMAHNPYGPEAQPMFSSPVYSEQPKQPAPMPVELN